MPACRARKVSASRGKAFEAHLYAFSAMAPLQHKPIALVVGNETEGISDEVLQQADVVVLIPMSGSVEALNVGVATGISLYELKFRMVLTMLTHFIRSNFGHEVNVTGQMIMQAFDHALRNVTGLNALQVVLLMMLAVDLVSESNPGQLRHNHPVEVATVIAISLWVARGRSVGNAATQSGTTPTICRLEMPDLWTLAEGATRT
jgi:hypothetical protein